jgi:S-adenosylmethionine:diacylglycerol 3-amino-3-carboxypropyl transferase
MEKDAYFRKKNEVDSKAAIKKHVEDKGTCEQLFELANRVILNYKGYDEDPSLDELEDMIRNIKFRQHKKQ